MIFRRFLLGLGALALVIGLGLAFVWVRVPAAVIAESPKVPLQNVLATARALATGSLLRADDLRWVQMASTDVPPDSLVRSPTAESEVLGAATRRAFRENEVLVADQLIKPSNPGFLPAVLAPGLRATTIAVDPAEGGAGMISPGDYVDVILTQTFTDPSISASLRSVGETILRNLRVIAINQTTDTAGKPALSEIRTAVTPESHLPKTVTLEVTVRQAEALMVAGQLGKLQLTLRSLADTTKPASLVSTPPTWASEVSPALLSLAHRPVPTHSSEGTPALAAPIVLEIIRGSKGERICYSGGAGSTADCGVTPESAVPTRPASPGRGALVSEGPAIMTSTTK